MSCIITLPDGQKIITPDTLPCGGFQFLSHIFGNVISLMLLTVCILALISLMWSGVQWSMSAGDKNKLVRARARITWSIVGLIISFLAFFIVNIVAYIFNVKLF